MPDRKISFSEMSKEQLVEECEALQYLLADSEQTLNQRNVEFQEFVYLVSHDLSSDIRAACGFSKFLKVEYEKQLDANANKYINFIASAAKRMRRRLDGLTTLSRISISKSSFEMTNLNDVFNDVLAATHETIVSTGATVTADDLPTVAGDRLQLQNLLENLISNSLSFKGEDAPSVHVSVKQNATELIISVTDNGVGVEPDDHEKVFNIFHRVDPAGVHDGTGMGLTICRRIAQRHRGRIWLETRDGGGSIVRFVLPISSTSVIPQKRKPLSTPTSQQRA